MEDFTFSKRSVRFFPQNKNLFKKSNKNFKRKNSKNSKKIKTKILKKNQKKNLNKKIKKKIKTNKKKEKITSNFFLKKIISKKRKSKTHRQRYRHIDRIFFVRWEIILAGLFTTQQSHPVRALILENKKEPEEKSYS